MFASDWIEKDKNAQLQVFLEKGKKRRSDLPKEGKFISPEEYEKAKRGRFILCAKEGHQGDRLLSSGQYYEKDNQCKSCKQGYQAVRREAALPPPFASVFEYLRSNPLVFKVVVKLGVSPASSSTTIVPLVSSRLEVRAVHAKHPLKTQFGDNEDEFKQAYDLVDSHNRRYNNEHSADHYERTRDEQNAKKRKEWATDPEENKRAKMQRDQEHKKKRMNAPLRQGYSRCKTGPHDLPSSEMIFCPISDLGMLNYNGEKGQLPRSFCKEHFPGSVCKHRRCNKKPERIEQKKMYEKQVHTKAGRVQRDANRRGIPFELSKEEVEHLVSPSSICYYCGVQRGEDEPRLGVDRVDDREEYNSENCVSCCKNCNKAKGGLSKEDYIQACINVHLFNVLGISNTVNIPYTLGTHGPDRKRNDQEPIFCKKGSDRKSVV